MSKKHNKLSKKYKDKSLEELIRDQNKNYFWFGNDFYDDEYNGGLSESKEYMYSCDDYIYNSNETAEDTYFYDDYIYNSDEDWDGIDEGIYCFNNKYDEDIYSHNNTFQTLGNTYVDESKSAIPNYKMYERICQRFEFAVCDDSQIYEYIQEKGLYMRLNSSVLAKLTAESLTFSENQSVTTYKVKQVEDRIRRECGKRFTSNDINSKKYLLNCLNGVLSFEDGSIKLLPHSSEYIFDYCIEAEYEEGVICEAENFEKFCLTSLGGVESKKKLLLEFFGYCLSDSNDAKKILFLNGKPNSGKSIALKFLQRLVGEDKVSNIPIHELSTPFNRAQLFGKKINIQAEMKTSPLNDISIIKAITGGDRITAEYKGQDSFSFMPKCKLIFAGNALPTTTDFEATKAFTNRLAVLLFNKSISAEEQDKELLEKLWAERNEIFTLSIKALLDLINRDYVFTSNEDSERFIAAYSMDADPVGCFLNEEINFIPSGNIPVRDFYESVKTYCIQNGFSVPNDRDIGKALLEKYNIPKKRINKDGLNVYRFVGIDYKERGENNA